MPCEITAGDSPGGLLGKHGVGDHLMLRGLPAGYEGKEHARLRVWQNAFITR
jgi:hypothetical protein